MDIYVPPGFSGDDKDDLWIDEDLVNSPPHYSQGKVECIAAIEAALTPEEWRGFLKGQILKYVWREPWKGGKIDVSKALYYAQRLEER